VFIDTAPTTWLLMQEAIRAATMVVSVLIQRGGCWLVLPIG